MSFTKIKSIYRKKLLGIKTGTSFIVKTEKEAIKFRHTSYNLRIKLIAIKQKNGTYKITILDSSKVRKNMVPNWNVDINNLPIPKSAYERVA